MLHLVSVPQLLMDVYLMFSMPMVTHCGCPWQKSAIDQELAV